MARQLLNTRSYLSSLRADMHLNHKFIQFAARASGRIRIIALVIAVSLVVALAALGCNGEKPVIKLHAWQNDSHFLSNAIFEFVVENGYGYPVETVVMTTPVMQESIITGEVDLNLEGWQQNSLGWYTEHVEKGNIVNLGMNYEGGPQFFMIPSWVAEKHGIKTVFDMQEHGELFKDPEDPSKGIFYSGIIGWEASTINEVKLEAYGLDRYYNPVTPGSGDALKTALARRQEEKRPVFSYYWEPTGLMGAYDWFILEEPVYTESCWEKVLAATREKSLRPIDDACEYPNPYIDKIAHTGLQRKAGDVVEMLEKMSIGLDPLNTTLAWVDQNEIQDWEAAAVHYLRANEDRWRSWVTPKAYEKVKVALEEFSG